MMQTDTQFSIFLVNKPGVLAHICQQLADKKVNVVGMSMMDSMEHGVLRLVAEDAKKARRVISAMDVPTTETDVLVTKLPNRAGALADVVGRLAQAHINVNYAYCTTGAANGKTIGIFKIADVKKAMKVLSERKPRRKTSAYSSRRPTTCRTGALNAGRCAFAIWSDSRWIWRTWKWLNGSTGA